MYLKLYKYKNKFLYYGIKWIIVILYGFYWKLVVNIEKNFINILLFLFFI